VPKIIFGIRLSDDDSNRMDISRDQKYIMQFQTEINVILPTRRVVKIIPAFKLAP